MMRVMAGTILVMLSMSCFAGRGSNTHKFFVAPAMFEPSVSLGSVNRPLHSFMQTIHPSFGQYMLSMSRLALSIGQNGLLFGENKLKLFTKLAKHYLNFVNG